MDNQTKQIEISKETTYIAKFGGTPETNRPEFRVKISTFCDGVHNYTLPGFSAYGHNAIEDLTQFRDAIDKTIKEMKNDGIK